VQGEKNSIGIPPTITLGCNDDFFWSTNLQGIGFGNITNASNTFSFSEGNIYTIFDSGSPQIIVPWKFYDAILTNIM
jgi:hypothetical protein